MYFKIILTFLKTTFWNKHSNFNILRHSILLYMRSIHIYIHYCMYKYNIYHRTHLRTQLIKIP